MKITKINLHLLRNDEHFQFIDDVLDLAKEVGPDKLKVRTQYEALRAAHAKEDEALKKIPKSAMTAEIHDADRARDETFRGMVSANRTALKHYDPKVREAAVRVGIVLDGYGDLSHKSLAEQTSATYNLVVELTAKHAADTEMVEISGWITELDRRNNAVREMMHKRYDETAGRTDLVMAEVRADVDEAYRVAAERIDALMVVEGDAAEAPWGDFIRRLNPIVDRANHILAQRRGRAEAKREEEKRAEDGRKDDSWL